MTTKSPKCDECGRRVSEYYMVTNAIWDSYGCGKGEMHLECLARKMQRPIRLDDFTDAPINLGIKMGWMLAMDYVDGVENGNF